MVEQLPVKELVVGSSPAPGAKASEIPPSGGLLFYGWGGRLSLKKINK